MRSSRFISIIGVIALLTSVKVAEAKSAVYADDGSVSTTTVTKTLYGKATSIPTGSDKAPKSEDKDVGNRSRDRDQNHEYHTTIHHTYDAPRITEATSTHHVTETHMPTYAPSNSIRVSISTVQSPAHASSVSASKEEEVIVKTKTKQHKTKSKNKDTPTAILLPLSSSSSASAVKQLHTNSASSSSVSSMSTPAPAIDVATSSGIRSLISKNPANMASISSKMSSASSVVHSASNAPATPASMETATASSPSLAASTGGSASAIASPSSNALPTALASSPPASSSSAESAKPSSSSNDVNNVNNKKVGPSNRPSSANAGQSDKVIGSSLVLTCLMAAVAAF